MLGHVSFADLLKHQMNSVFKGRCF